MCTCHYYDTTPSHTSLLCVGIEVPRTLVGSDRIAPRQSSESTQTQIDLISRTTKQTNKKQLTKNTPPKKQKKTKERKKRKTPISNHYSTNQMTNYLSHTSIHFRGLKLLTHVVMKSIKHPALIAIQNICPCIQPASKTLILLSCILTQICIYLSVSRSGQVHGTLKVKVN